MSKCCWMATAAVAVIAMITCTLPLEAATVKVSNAGELKSAVGKAKPGDVIEAAPGVYDLGGRFSIGKNGAKGKPITLTCTGTKGYAVLKAGRTSMSCAFWHFKGIHFQGDPNSSEAALKLSGEQGCHDNVFTDCKVSGSKQHGIKASRTREKGADNITFEFCEVFDTGKTAMDFVSGDNWIVRRCYVHDYGKAGGISYGIFLKGGGKNGVIEGCLVDGKKVKGITVGISLGGGLTGEKWLPLVGGKVAPEHDKGIVRNCIVINTSDVAYHSNMAANSRFINNLSYNCQKLQCQKKYPPDPIAINNAIGKLIGGAKGTNNTGPGAKEWFTGPDKFDYRLTKEGEKALAGKGAHQKDCLEDLFGTKRDPKSSCVGPILPGAKDTAVWVDRRK